jgi:hypothetical protein
MNNARLRAEGLSPPPFFYLVFILRGLSQYGLWHLGHHLISLTLGIHECLQRVHDTAVNFTCFVMVLLFLVRALRLRGETARCEAGLFCYTVYISSWGHIAAYLSYRVDSTPAISYLRFDLFFFPQKCSSSCAAGYIAKGVAFSPFFTSLYLAFISFQDFPRRIFLRFVPASHSNNTMMII